MSLLAECPTIAEVKPSYAATAAMLLAPIDL